VRQPDHGDLQLNARFVSRRRCSGSEHGQALVEMAFILPVFLLVFVSLFDLGRAVFVYNTLTNAAREGARLAIVNQDIPTIIARAESQTAIAELNVPNVTVHFYQVNHDGTPDTSTPCPQSPPVLGQSYVAVDCLAVVTFEATYQPITPIVSNLLFSSGVTFTAKSVLPVEFTCPNNTLTAAQCPKQP
jgi:Flp pilus assembly protein TadG